CKPKNLGLSMDFTDYAWEDIAGTVVKENLLGSEFSFTTKTDIGVSIDYLPKAQARKIYTFAKEQMELLKSSASNPAVTEPANQTVETVEPEEIQTEEVIDYA